MEKKLLSVENLKTYFFTADGVVKAVDDVSFSIPPGKTLGLVGESGCGKTMTALSILRLVSPPGRIVGGGILYKDKDILKLSDDDMRDIRGAKISMVFQEPMTSLNPVFTIYDQVAEAFTAHKPIPRAELRDKTIEMLRLVGIPDPESRLKDYPHQLSGGMRQRAMIAMALCMHPDLIIADEPTTALDVTIQAQILDLLNKLQDELHMSILLITHDFGVIAEMVDEVAVMYAGKIVELAPVNVIFSNPLHPYTQGLLSSMPHLAVAGEVHGKRDRLSAIPGIVPNLLNPKEGCKFADRCTKVFDQCRIEEPCLIEVEKGHWVSCWRVG